MGGKLLTSNK
jgi:hypothetical protein